MRAPELPPNRVRISADLLRYAYDVHQADEHGGQLGYGCRVCLRYVRGISTTAAAELDQPDAFELPASAATAYATAVRPHVGGLVPTSPSDVVDRAVHAAAAGMAGLLTSPSPASPPQEPTSPSPRTTT